MEVRKLSEAGWFASYMFAPDGGNDAQGKALVECQMKKISQLNDLVTKISGEIELTEDPKEHSPEFVLQSIKELISQIGEVSHTEDRFKWVG